MSKKNANQKDVKKEHAQEKSNSSASPANGEGKEPEKQAEPTELEKALALAEDYKRKWYAVSAEYENFRKRNQLAVSNAYRDGTADAVLKLLPVADNFGYALDSAQDEKTRTGIDKVIKSFATILQSFGIEEIPVKVGDVFDEKTAEAIMNSPCEKGEKENIVKIVLKKGYRCGDKVIRYAQVAVTVKQ